MNSPFLLFFGRSAALTVILMFIGINAAGQSLIPIGVAQVDITPDYPVRLSGFGFRRTESEGVTQRIWAKALVFGHEKDGPVILITADNLCVPDAITSEIARRLGATIGLKPERLTITATHTHTAPMLKNVCPTLFGVPIPAEHQANIDRYTTEFVDKLEKVALAAFQAIKPAKVSYGLGNVRFAVNRRTKNGPVDHDLPVLVVREVDGTVRAVYFSYACHCVALSDNKISGDWAGFAQEAVQEIYSGAVALASIGCGADLNPESGVTGDKVDICSQQGRQVADEIKRILSGRLIPITAAPTTRYARLDIDFDVPRTRAEWEERAKLQDAVGHHARVTLEKLDRGETLPGALNYPIQSWLFGNELAIVFLPGETVVDYSLRLKREFDRERIWVNGYSNEGRCYLPSERILREGGYEGGGAMIYYDFPQRFAPGLEEKIFAAVRAQLPSSFQAPTGTEGTRPLSPPEALRAFHTKPGHVVELVAAEPIIQDPVAIDWGSDGKLWVCEMNDYPSGADNNWQPGGRVKFLEDRDGDGRYEKATTFAEGLPFPTGIMAWNGGILICAAPDILFARDSNGDGNADTIEKLFSGFATDNYQARVNSLTLGLDNWIYGANGLLSGTIESLRSSVFPAAPGAPVNIRGRDFRFAPRTGQLEVASGLTQQGRTRDDWGNWFGCDNTRLLLHFPRPEHYLRRNPHVAAPDAIRLVTTGPDANKLFPTSRLLERFNDPGQANRVTSAGGLGIYRDVLLGEEFYGNAFTCEPVHNLVHREVISGELTLSSTRAPDEKESEFLSSTDHWFRPVQARTGPDGALYIVDMYRFLIEHPRWIPAERLAQIDQRAGSDKGRIYRVRKKDGALRPIRDLTKISSVQLAAAMDTPNGMERDRLHLELLTRGDDSARPVLQELALKTAHPAVRLQALATLDALGGTNPKILSAALADPHPEIREHVIRLAEPTLRSDDSGALLEAIIALKDDPSPGVQRQLAYTMGEIRDERAGKALSALASKFLTNAEIRAAVLSSCLPHGAQVLEALLAVDETAAVNVWIAPLIATIAASKNDALLARAIRGSLPVPGNAPRERHLAHLVSIFKALPQDDGAVRRFFPADSAEAARLEDALAFARQCVTNETAPDTLRETALELAAVTSASDEDIALLAQVARHAPERARKLAVAGLRRHRSLAVPEQVLANWSQCSPAARAEFTTLLLDRAVWMEVLLKAIKRGDILASEISLPDRQRLSSAESPNIRALAKELFPEQGTTGRTEVVQNYSKAMGATGVASRGSQIFSEQCASCHRLNGVGYDIGPDLAPMQVKDSEYWLKNILDPNAIVEPRFVSYLIELKDDRTLSGLIKSETSTSLIVVSGNGITETVLRSNVREIRASTLSLMPEGLEQAIKPEQMADLLAFVKTNSSPKTAGAVPPPADVDVLRDPASVARFILDPTRTDAARQTAVQANPQFAAALVAEMTRDLTPGAPEEYVRIPWIWRVAIACGKRNDAGQIRALLDSSLPKLEEPLRDWQAVVLGGGIINGISERGVPPAERLDQIISSEQMLAKRWRRSLDLASAMAENTKVSNGTRYDALRMLGLEAWDKRGQQLVHYLGKDINAELQMGAVSALLDMNSEHAFAALNTALPQLSEGNRTIVLDGLARRGRGGERPGASLRK